MSTKKLQASEELCLSAFVDGECGWIKKIFARRTLSKNFEARRFVDELERTSDQIQRSYSTELNTLSEDVSLWPRISARIAQEERLTLLRSIPLESGTQFSWLSRLSWGGLGAVAASMLILIYLPINSAKQASEYSSNAVKVISTDGRGFNAASPQLTNVSQVQNAQDGVSEEDYRALHLASLQRNRAAEISGVEGRDPNVWRFLQQTPQFIESEQANGLSLSNQRRVIAPQVFEADWMRSNGRVRVLQDPSGKAGIIWVNRPHNTVVARANNTRTIGQSGQVFLAGTGNR